MQSSTWRNLRRHILIVGVLVLAGCANLPGSGPTTDGVLGAATVEIGSAAIEPFVLVTVTTPLLHDIQEASLRRVAAQSTLVDTEPPAFAIREGDTVQVSLVNVSADGFLDFAGSAISPFSVTPMPDQLVGADGRINVPALGRVRAAGLSPERLERTLTEALSQVLVEPSVLVQVVDRRSARAAVFGQVGDPGSKPILRPNLRLVDLIGLAGGQSAPSDELEVTFVRGDAEVTLPLTEVLTDPRANIRIHPGDVVSIERSRRSYVIRGAVTLPGRYELTGTSLSLEEAIALARGIANRRASRKGVFVYRPMSQPQLNQLGVDVSQFSAEVVPTIFHFDYRLPTTIFAAQAFEMEDGDVVFVSDHLIEELSKIFGIFTTVVPVQSFIPAPTVQ